MARRQRNTKNAVEPKAATKKTSAKKAPSKTATKAKKSVPRKAKVQPKPPREIRVKVAAAKGRPMLTWVGKRPLSQVTGFPPQLVERHDAHNILGLVGDDTVHKRRRVFAQLREHWNAECWEDQPTPYGVAVPESGGLLLHGDNLECMATLLAAGYRGKVDLIYIDPPFDSGADYVRKVNLRGVKGGAKLDGETYTLGEQIQYTDIWTNDNYLQFMYERLLLLKELLAPTGAIAVHLDYRRAHTLRLVMDEVFGAENFINHIVWHYFGFKRSTSGNFPRKHDDIFLYAKSDQYVWHTQYRPHSDEYLKRWKQDDNGRYYRDDVNPTGGGSRLIYLDEVQGDIVDSVWEDIPPVNPVATERQDFPTQKPEELVERMIQALSDPGGLVLDSFIGSGTTGAVAQKLGRRWIGCDINKGAIQTTVKRLRSIIGEEIAQALGDKKERAGKLPGISESKVSDTPKPTQFGFSVWRVNDYDLQIQHNEAVNLACEHIGVQRTRSDAYFEGVLGKKLVKIVPFDHPLSPLDLEELKRELDARPDEDRNITMVCLGMEVAAGGWVEGWNRLRKGSAAVNRLDVIELRTDPKYGKFIKHEPPRAKVKMARKKDRIQVKIEDFISPTIIERLQQQAGVVSPKIDDWRAMVDSVMIDTAYDGKVFNVVLADVPEKKSDLVDRTYDLAAPDDETTVAVKITDMLGEEVLVTGAV